MSQGRQPPLDKEKNAILRKTTSQQPTGNNDTSTEGTYPPCPVCNKDVRDEDMAKCTKCRRWVHYECANVGDEVMYDVSWICPICLAKLKQPKNLGAVAKPAVANQQIAQHSTARSVACSQSNVSSRREKLIEEALEKSRKEQELLDRERKIVAEQVHMLLELSKISKVRSSASQDSRSVCSETGGRLAELNVVPNSVAESLAAPPQAKSMPAARNEAGGQIAELDYVFNSAAQPLAPAQQQKTIPSTLPRPFHPPPIQQFHVGPSQTQIAARHVMGKELPKFNGDPSDWPLFISAYRETTLACGFTASENMTRLRKCLEGRARDVVKDKLIRGEFEQEVLDRLQSLFGRPELIIDNLLAKVRSCPDLKDGNFDSIVGFSIEVQNLCSALESPGCEDHRRNPMLLKEFVEKLPPSFKLKWASEKSQIADYQDVPAFGNWLYRIAMEICQAIPSVAWKKQYKPTKKEMVHYHSSKCLICYEECSSAATCKTFREAPIDKRWQYVKDLHLCRKCLKQHSFRKPCHEPVKCMTDRCEKKHHPMLHSDGSKNISKQEGEQATTTSNFTHLGQGLDTRYRYIPIILSFKDRLVSTYAFLDEGSSTTLISQKLADQLGAKGEKRPLSLTWTDNSVCRTEDDSEQLKLNIKLSGNRCANLYARTISTLHLPAQSLNYPELFNKYPYLKNLPVKSYSKIKPDLLIGLDNWKLAVPRRVKEGLHNEPIAAKCQLGWTIFATSGHTEAGQFFHSCECSISSDNELTALVKSFYAVDRMGVRASPNALTTKEEQRASKLMSETLRKVNGRFEIGLLWKYDAIELPDSKPMAIKRLKCLEASLKRKPQMFDEVDRQLAEYEEKGYIHRLTDDEKSFPQKRVWYLPIFPVQNPNKPEKVRLVWDAAAKVNGISLNSALVSGPDLTASLFGVLLRFRQKRIAITGDIQEMFHRVMVKPDDQHAQRFLWRGKNPKSEPVEYLMRVMTFGSTCSPSCAQFIKNQNALGYSEVFPEACHAIVKNHYVDDWLQSFDTVKDTIAVANDVKNVHAKAGFLIRNWRSNSYAVPQALGEEIKKEICINLNLEQKDEKEKVLGLWWDCKNDAFTYSLKYNKGNQKILQGEQVPTKRELLRILMSIYDPLGLIAHFLVFLKVLLQDTWRRKTNWDDEIDNDQYQLFTSWLQLLPRIEKLKIPRCYVHEFDNYLGAEVEMHTFVDASADACAAASYFRVQKSGKVRCILVAAKSHVAPLKLISIPNLEVEAALLGARLARSIDEHIEVKFLRRIFWSDSSTVLSWIQSSNLRRLGKFVAFRIAEIQELTNSSDWRYVPSAQNVADDATKWTKPPKLDSSNRWFIGPSFLSQPESDWPVQKYASSNVECEEELVAVHETAEAILDVKHFSTWKKLRKTIALLFYFKRRTLKCTTEKVILPSDYHKAELWLYRLAQGDVFSREINALRHSADLQKISVIRKSPLRKLSPYLDEDDVLRVKGRIDLTNCVSVNTKRPVILPKGHYITELIVSHYHRKYGHLHHDIVVNELRQVYHIPQIRVVLNNLRRKCFECKIKYPTIIQPEMGALPSARITPYEAPFTYTGVDYLGPFYVTVKRSNEKRWAVLFTCLVTRAIHVEVAYSLDTDSCVLCLRTFMLMRGQPAEIYSDCGTNFVATEKLLREELQKVDISMVASKFQEEGIRWVFNPPASPHMGGAWERLVRALKRALYAVTPNRNFTDPLLKACLAEAAYMVNSRPLTYLPLDSDQGEALTPNHFLLGSSNGVKSVGVAPAGDMCLKAKYLTAQQFRENLWKRWVQEYLPDLVCRSKNFFQTEPLQVGDLVILCDSNQQANTWPKARVLEVHPGKDGQVRSATIQTSKGIYLRPATKLAPIKMTG